MASTMLAARYPPRVRAVLLLLVVSTSACPMEISTSAPIPAAGEAACEAGDAAACLRAADDELDRDRANAFAVRACTLDPKGSCARAADIVDDKGGADWKAERAAEARAIDLRMQGCRAGDPVACATAGKGLHRASRCDEVAALVDASCTAGDAASCRELVKASLLGCAGAPPIPDAKLLAEKGCAAKDRHSCFLLGYLALSGRAGPRDIAAAEAAFAAGCAGVSNCAAAWMHDGAAKYGGISTLAMVRQRGGPVVVDIVGPTPPPFAEVVLSALGPFELGRVSIGGLGVAGGAAYDIEGGRMSFHATADFRIQTPWGPGDLVSIRWRAPDPENDASKCASEYECRKGYCTAKDGTCIRASASDCERSDDCRERGACGWEQGRCIATEAGCRASEQCKSLKMCTLGDGYCTSAGG
jgi:hypothetical protein